MHHLLHPPPLVGGRRVGLAVDQLGPGLGLELPGGMAPEPRDRLISARRAKTRSQARTGHAPGS